MNKKWGQAFRLAVDTRWMVGGGEADPESIPLTNRHQAQSHFETTTAKTDLSQIALATENRN